LLRGSTLQRQASKFAHSNAKRLRGAMTNAEQRLWLHLRRTNMGVRFRRQHPFGSYIADFACLEPKLVIEVDGPQHAEQRDHDARRDAFFAQRGFSTLRFNADEVLSDTDGVLSMIFDAIARQRAIAPSLTLPHRGRGPIEPGQQP